MVDSSYIGSTLDHLGIPPQYIVGMSKKENEDERGFINLKISALPFRCVQFI